MYQGGLYGTEEKEHARYDEAIKKERNLQIRNETLYCLIHPFLGFILNIGTFFLLYYTATNMLDGTMTYGEASKFSSEQATQNIVIKPNGMGM